MKDIVTSLSLLVIKKNALEPQYFSKTMSSPVGLLTLVAGSRGLCAILWENDKPGRVPLGSVAEDREHAILLKAEQQLNEYFNGERTEFDLLLHFEGTPFQVKVWEALLTIPFGETRTYTQIAAQVGSPGAVRAVGAANGKNPISVIAPCHRVIGASGKLTGFAGGLPNKAFLLHLEGIKNFAKEMEVDADKGQPTLQLDIWS